jgi:5-hydroxyisourate hydrolase-like protein (transthyretin family)
MTAVLRDENGQPIVGAQVSVMQLMNVPGAQWTPARSPLTTDASGRMSWTIPASFGRTVRFAYKANLANADFQSTLDIVLKVRSKTSFNTNRSRFRNGDAVRFSGRVASRPVPRSGVLIDLQAKVGRKWQTFKTTRTASTGRWKASYRFHATSGLQRYSFRARIRHDSGFPYLPSGSRTLRVAVRG